MKPAILLPLLVLVTGCGERLSAEEKSRRDARDVAAVERVQKQLAPPQPITLEVIPPAERKVVPPQGKGCAFVPRDAPDGGPIGLFGAVTGHVRVDGRLLALAPDTGSSQLPGGAWSKYVGKTHLLRLSESQAGSEAWLEVLDPHDRPVYITPGLLQCDGPPRPSPSGSSVPER